MLFIFVSDIIAIICHRLSHEGEKGEIFYVIIFCEIIQNNCIINEYYNASKLHFSINENAQPKHDYK